MTENLINGLHKKSESLPRYSWQEVAQHNSKENAWIVIEDLVLDVSDWMKKHPGGARIISQYAGQDASEVWYAMHLDKIKVTKYMAPLVIGRVDPLSRTGEFWVKRNEITRDFKALRQHAEDSGWFKADPLFFALAFGHVILLELMVYGLMWWNHRVWYMYTIGIIFLTISQIQSTFNGHDCGHLSVMPTSRLNHIMSSFVMNLITGASFRWWSYRHSLHHSKPNRLGKDPDITLTKFVLFGSKVPKIWAEKRKGSAPYGLQHLYFFLIVAPSLVTFFFHYDVIYFIIKRRLWKEIIFFFIYGFRLFYTYGTFVGHWECFKFYMLVRMLHSVWFTLISQMSHIPMEVEDKDTPNIDWFTLHVTTTCNVTQSAFNDWFTGHLNFQIEHHLFPTMPRHNLVKVAPLVKDLCKKHNIPYVEKTLTTAFADIYRSLKNSAQIWYAAYYKLDENRKLK